MDFYVINALTELGIVSKLPLSFPTPEQMNFIETIASQENTSEALKSSPETKTFEEEGLENLVSAHEFFRKLQHVSQKGSYKSASIRMDVQISTRLAKHAPDCKLNMNIETEKWNKKLNISMVAADKLLNQLLEARKSIIQSRETPRTEIE